MCERFMHMLGLAERAHAVRSGSLACEQALRRGKARLVVVAEDAAEEVRLTLVAEARSKGIKVVTVPSKIALGQAIGKSPRAALIVTDAGFAQKLWSMSQETGGGISV